MLPLSIDIEVLNQYKFIESQNTNFDSIGFNVKNNSELLAIKNENNTKRLIKIPTADLTLWNIILRFFGCGKLVHVDFKIRDISNYFAQFDWKSYSNNPDKN